MAKRSSPPSPAEPALPDGATEADPAAPDPRPADGGQRAASGPGAARRAKEARPGRGRGRSRQRPAKRAPAKPISAAQLAANRANAAKSRETVGRPPAAMPAEVLAELGAVPTDPAAVPGWLLRASAALWLCEASGKISGEYASRLRNGLSAIAKFAPVAAAPSSPAAGGAERDEWDDDDEPAAGGPHRERSGPRRADQAVAVG